MTALSLEALIARARRRLPRQHRALLEQIDVQEAIVENWPSGVEELYETLSESPPGPDVLAGAVAVWLPQLRVVAFNARLLRHALADEELTEATRQAVIDNIA